MYSLNQRFDNTVIPEDEFLTSGNLACAGCAASLSMRLALKGLGKPTVLAVPACCWTIIPGAWPVSIMDVPFFHCAFETTAATASGIKAAFRRRGMDDICVVGWAGDGGTLDIGIQALSGAAERNEDVVYVCYDNEAYMNTGIQRSSSTPWGASTTTSPAGKISKGQHTQKKDLPKIAIAHNIPYVATACPSFPFDLMEKVQKAAAVQGPAYLHIFSVCPTGWRIPPEEAIRYGRLAVNTCVFPLYEYEYEKYRLTYRPSPILPVREYIEGQGRFRHLTPEDIDSIEERTMAEYEKLVKLSEEG